VTATRMGAFIVHSTGSNAQAAQIGGLSAGERGRRGRRQHPLSGEAPFRHPICTYKAAKKRPPSWGGRSGSTQRCFFMSWGSVSVWMVSLQTLQRRSTRIGAV